MSKTKDLITQLDEELIAKRAEVQEIEEKRRVAKLATLLKEEEKLLPLVCQAHELFCQWNHCDGCGWHYEIDSKTNKHSWDGGIYSAHARWLNKTKEMMIKYKWDLATLEEKLKEVKAFKAIHPDIFWIYSQFRS